MYVEFFFLGRGKEWKIKSIFYDYSSVMDLKNLESERFSNNNVRVGVLNFHVSDTPGSMVCNKMEHQHGRAERIKKKKKNDFNTLGHGVTFFFFNYYFQNRFCRIFNLTENSIRAASQSTRIHLYVQQNRQQWVACKLLFAVYLHTRELARWMIIVTARYTRYTLAHPSLSPDSR